MVSPTFPPELIYVTFKSVETPVAKRPLDATAREPPRSTIIHVQVSTEDEIKRKSWTTHRSDRAAMKYAETVLGNDSASLGGEV
jgi:hypothetical protein